MRKSFLVASVATLVLGTTGVAIAQTPDPSIDVKASVSPTKAGTKSKPKAVTFKLEVTNNPASKTTAKSITVKFPSTIKLSTKGLDQCTATDEALIANVNVCKKAFAGTGSASALLGPTATNPGPLSFKVQPIVGKNELLFVLSGSANAVLHGAVKGSTLTIAITPQLQQPLPGVYSALNGLKTTISKKKGSKSLISTTGCKSKKHVVSVTVGYVPNPGPPSKPSATNTSDAKCS